MDMKRRKRKKVCAFFLLSCLDPSSSFSFLHFASSLPSRVDLGWLAVCLARLDLNWDRLCLDLGAGTLPLCQILYVVIPIEKRYEFVQDFGRMIMCELRVWWDRSDEVGAIYVHCPAGWRGRERRENHRG